MPQPRIRTGNGQPVRALGTIEHAPRRGQQPEPATDQDEAQHVERTEVRIGPPAEHHLEQMAGVVAEPIDAWEARRQPAREQIDRQREAVHLGEQRDEEGGERAERAPVALRLRPREAERENDEDERIDDHE